MMPTRTAMHRTSAVFALVVGLGFGLGHPARAQPAKPVADDRANADEAARLYDEGKRHFDIGEYAQAITSWKQSYLRSNAPLLLFNIAQAYRLSNDCAQANRFYLNYRRSEPHPKNQAELGKAMAKCAGVEPATGDATPSEPPASPASPTTGTPPATPPVTVPSDRAASGTASSSPASSRVDHVTAQPSNRGGGLRIAGLVTGTVGAAALVASGVYAIQAKQDSNTISGARAGTANIGEVASTDQSGKTAASRAQVLLGAGAALAVVGGVMWYVGHRQGNAQVDVAIVPGHTEVMFSCAF